MKYHITDTGPKPCRASKKPCPIRGEHYSSPEEAMKAYEKNISKGLSTLPLKLSKTVTITSRVEPLNNKSYYGCEIDSKVVSSFEKDFTDLVGTNKAEEYRFNKSNRASGSGYHVTVLTPKETRALKNRNIELPDNPRIELIGVGSIESGDNKAWYVVCASPELDQWRNQHNLPPKDYHITLGFHNKDVYDKFKGKDTLI